ncbi:MAG: branched-chain amino acid ABC transporter substrate-binding protein [Rhodospirillales bacterium]|nr:branched-chain amino acid ABC transporter substrate-binding protein [Rhodospirillales bacterium]
MTKKITSAIAVAAAVALMGTGSAQAAEIIFGVPGAHSGDLASYGLPTVNAAKLVVEQYNAKGGLLGMKIKVVPQDEQCKPELATNAAFKLVSEKVTVALGHICSGATKAALPIYKDSKIVLMSPSATNPELTLSGDYPNFFRTIGRDDNQGKIGASFTMGKLGAKKIAVIHDKGDYGKGYAERAKEAVDGSGGKATTVLFEGVTPGAVDYTAIVQKIKQSGAEAVIFGGYHPEASKIVMTMRKRDMKIPFVSDDGVKDATFIKVAGEFAEGVYASGPEDYSGNPLYHQANEAHKKAFNADPGVFYPQAYSAALALLNAIEKAGSTDYDKIVKALRTEYVETPVGKIRFDERGDAEGVGFDMYQVVKGEFVLVK